MTITIQECYRGLYRKVDEEVQTAVDLLSRMEDPTRAFAVVARYKELQYREERGLTLYVGGSNCIRRVAGKRCAQDFQVDCPTHSFLGDDHGDLWRLSRKDGTSELLYISEPYGLHRPELESLQKLCQELDLNYYVSSGVSAHFPGWTVGVIITRKDTDYWNELRHPRD